MKEKESFFNLYFYFCQYLEVKDKMIEQKERKGNIFKSLH
jgi:hypothetical protein